MATSTSQLKKNFTQCITQLQTAKSQDECTAIARELAYLFSQIDTDGDQRQMHEHIGLIIHNTLQSINKTADKALVQIERLGGERALAQNKLEEAEQKIALLQAENDALRARQMHQTPVATDSVPKSAHDDSQESGTDACIPGRSSPQIGRPQIASGQTTPMHSQVQQNEQISQASTLSMSEQMPRPPALPIFCGYRDDSQRQIHHPQWDNWHSRFELHFGSLPEAAKVRQLLLHLGGEASQYQSTMLDYQSQQSYDALIEAFTRHYTHTKAPFVALREYDELRQGSQDVRSFAQRFQEAYALASKLNPSAKKTEEQLKVSFVSKVNEELHRILVIRHPNYHIEMPLHRIVAELSGIEHTIMPPQYNKTSAFGQVCVNNDYKQRTPRMGNKPCGICGRNNHTTANCRLAKNRPKSDNPSGNSRSKDRTRDTRAQYIGMNEAVHHVELDALTNAVLNAQSEQSQDLAKSQRAKLAYSRYRQLYSPDHERWQNAIAPKPAMPKLVVNGIKVSVLIDTGSQANLIAKSAVKQLRQESSQWRASWAMRTLIQSAQSDNDNPPKLCSASGEEIKIDCLIDAICGEHPSKCATRITFAVTTQKLQHIILGLPALKALGVKLKLPGGGEDYLQQIVDSPRTASSSHQCEASPATVTQDVTPSPKMDHRQSCSHARPTKRTQTAFMKARKAFKVQPGTSIHAPVSIDQNGADIHNNPCYFVEISCTRTTYICDTPKAAKALCYIANNTESPMIFKKGEIIANIEAYDAYEESKFIRVNNMNALRSRSEDKRETPLQKEEAEVSDMAYSQDRWQERIEFVNEHLKFGTAFDTEQQQQVRALIEQYADIVCLDSSDLPPSKAPKFHIDTGDSPPFKIRPRPIPPASRECLAADIQNMLKSRVIERVIDSPYNSPVVVVPKRDTNKWRMTIDLRKLNSQTQFAVARLPHIQELIYGLKNKPYISSFDMQSAFWQIELEEKDRNKTTFSIPGPAPPGGTYRFLRMPFGAMNSAQHYQHAIEQMIRPVAVCNETRMCQAYIDDLIVATSNFEEHISLLKQLFQCLREHCCKLNLPKSILGATEIRYLGFIVDSDSYRPQPERVEPILKIRPPTNITEIKSFIGKLIYYQRCLPDLQIILEPLHQVLRGTSEKGKRKASTFYWGAQQQKAFERAKQLLAQVVPMYHPDIAKPFELVCDACEYGVGAALAQEDENGVKRPISFMSKILSRTQRKYSTTEKEFLAVLLGLEANRQWIACSQVDVITDHAPLVALLKSTRETNPRLERWRCRIRYFTIRNIKYVPGPLNLSADYLSRLTPFTESSQKDEDAASDVGIPEAVKQMPGVIAVDCHLESEENTFSEDWYEIIAPSGNKLHKAQCADPECRILHKLILSEQSKKAIKEASKALKHRTTRRSKATAQLKQSEAESAQEVQAPQYLRAFARSCDIVDNYVVSMSPVTEEYVPVIPRSMRREVLHIAHSAPSSGHMRLPKLYRVLLSKCNWPRMNGDIAKYLKDCTKCNEVNPGIGYKPEWHYVVPGEPMQFLNIDVAKMSSVTEIKYALIATCTFTRYIWAIPIASQDAQTQIDALTKHIIAEHGYPQVIVTDAHPVYCGNEFSEWCKLNAIEHLHGTGYSKVHNSLAERAIATIRNQLRKSCTDERDWIQCLPLLTLSYNSAPNLTTGYSPSFLLHMREPRVAIDQILAAPKKLHLTDAPSFALRQASILAKAYEQCRQNIAANRDKAAKAYAKKVGKNVPRKVQVGDLVLRRSAKAALATRSWKLKRAYGPYRVTKIENVHATLSTIDGIPVEKAVNIRNLCPLREKAFLPCFLSDSRVARKNSSPSVVTLSSKYGKMNGKKNNKSLDLMEFTEPQGNVQPEDGSPAHQNGAPVHQNAGSAHQNYTPARNGSNTQRAKKKKKKRGDKKKWAKQRYERYRREREEDMMIAARIAQQTSVAVYSTIEQRFTQYNPNVPGFNSSTSTSRQQVPTAIRASRPVTSTHRPQPAAADMHGPGPSTTRNGVGHQQRRESRTYPAQRERKQLPFESEKHLSKDGNEEKDGAE